MKKSYDFSEGKRGRIIPPEPEQPGPESTRTRITIRLDEDLIDHFLKEADGSGRAIGYQTPLHLTANEARRQHVGGKAPRLEDTLRRILREELTATS